MRLVCGAFRERLLICGFARGAALLLIAAIILPKQVGRDGRKTRDLSTASVPPSADAWCAYA